MLCCNNRKKNTTTEQQNSESTKLKLMKREIHQVKLFREKLSYPRTLHPSTITSTFGDPGSDEN